MPKKITDWDFMKEQNTWQTTVNCLLSDSGTLLGVEAKSERSADRTWKRRSGEDLQIVSPSICGAHLPTWARPSPWQCITDCRRREGEPRSHQLPEVWLAPSPGRHPPWEEPSLSLQTTILYLHEITSKCLTSISRGKYLKIPNLQEMMETVQKQWQR